MTTMTPGPFENEPAAIAAARAACGGEPDVSAAANLRLLQQALEASGVETGDFDDLTLAYLSRLEQVTCAVVAGLVLRAYAAGRVSAREDSGDEERS